MNYKPTLQDAAADLRRCIYASFSPKGFEDSHVHDFLAHAKKIIFNNKLPDTELIEQVNRLIMRAQDLNLELSKRREDLLTAASLLTPQE